MTLSADITARYRRFAAEAEALGSALYSVLADHVAESEQAQAFLRTLPTPRQQPNLLFAAIRAASGLPLDGDDLVARLATDGDAIRHVMLTRTTQTNEAGRCATLMTALSHVRGPIALLEVGCSAGLCLLPDRYGYRFESEGGRMTALPGGPPTLTCRVNDRTPLPTAPLEIVWRAGLDLAPVNVETPEDVAWLRALIFPEHHDRAERLDLALTALRADPPELVQGDLLTDLTALAAKAPADARLVIFHTAVLMYVDPTERDRFTSTVGRLGALWVSNEAPDILPEIAAKAPTQPNAGVMLMAINGTPVAWTNPHGRHIDWFGPGAVVA